MDTLLTQISQSLTSYIHSLPPSIRLMTLGDAIAMHVNKSAGGGVSSNEIVGEMVDGGEDIELKSKGMEMQQQNTKTEIPPPVNRKKRGPASAQNGAEGSSRESSRTMTKADSSESIQRDENIEGTSMQAPSTDKQDIESILEQSVASSRRDSPAPQSDTSQSVRMSTRKSKRAVSPAVSTSLQPPSVASSTRKGSKASSIREQDKSQTSSVTSSVRRGRRPLASQLPADTPKATPTRNKRNLSPDDHIEADGKENIETPRSPKRLKTYHTSKRTAAKEPNTESQQVEEPKNHDNKTERIVPSTKKEPRPMRQSIRLSMRPSDINRNPESDGSSDMTARTYELDPDNLPESIAQLKHVKRSDKEAAIANLQKTLDALMASL